MSLQLGKSDGKLIQPKQYTGTSDGLWDVGMGGMERKKNSHSPLYFCVCHFNCFWFCHLLSFFFSKENHTTFLELIQRLGLSYPVPLQDSRVWAQGSRGHPFAVEKSRDVAGGRVTGLGAHG